MYSNPGPRFRGVLREQGVQPSCCLHSGGREGHVVTGSDRSFPEHTCIYPAPAWMMLLRHPDEPLIDERVSNRAAWSSIRGYLEKCVPDLDSTPRDHEIPVDTTQCKI